MEAIGSPSTKPDMLTVAQPEALRRPGPDRPGDAPAKGDSTPPARGEIPAQKGFQKSEDLTDEFKPYTRDGAQKEASTGTDKPGSDGTSGGDAAQEQDPQIQAEIAQLKATDARVKAHEAAHKSAGGTMTGPVSYTYTKGPDGKSYVTGGEVPIAITPGKTPQETVSRMQKVIQAALAPADPSPQDRSVAAQAATQQMKASQELASAALPQAGQPEQPEATPPDQGTQPDTDSARKLQRVYGNPATNGTESSNTGTINRQAGVSEGTSPVRSPLHVPAIQMGGVAPPEQNQVSYFA